MLYRRAFSLSNHASRGTTVQFSKFYLTSMNIHWFPWGIHWCLRGIFWFRKEFMDFCKEYIDLYKESLESWFSSASRCLRFRAKVDKFVSMASLTEFLSSSGACKCSVQMLWILLELSAQNPRHFGSTGCKSSGGLQWGCARGCAGVVRWLCGHFQGYHPLRAYHLYACGI